MDFSNLDLPSNKKFGFFFTAVFLLAGIYFYIEKSLLLVYLSASMTFLFFIMSFFKPDLLLPLNKLWMRFGLLLGMIVSPVVIGLIFFGLFTPIALLMKLAGRDELRLQYVAKSSYWVQRSASEKTQSFRNQF